MKLHILDDVRFGPRLNRSFRKICTLIDRELGELPGIVNVVYCTDQTIRRLNRNYRGKDKVTDVLTFPYFEEPTNTKDLLGEVYLDISQAKRQVTQVKKGEMSWYFSWMEREHKVWTLDFEMYKLCIHGLLHLRGYDHIKNEDFRVMKLLEDKIMNRLLESQKR